VLASVRGLLEELYAAGHSVETASETENDGENCRSAKRTTARTAGASKERRREVRERRKNDGEK
jgi:hypothetical protein